MATMIGLGEANGLRYLLLGLLVTGILVFSILDHMNAIHDGQRPAGPPTTAERRPQPRKVALLVTVLALLAAGLAFSPNYMITAMTALNQ